MSPKLTDETNWRADAPHLMEKEEIKKTNKELEEASKEDLRPEHFKITSSGKVEKMAGNVIDPSEWNLGDIPEPEVLPDGEEVKVRITSVIEAETREAKIPYFRVMLEVVDNINVKDIMYMLYKPFSGQTPKQSKDTRYNMQNFMQAFKLDMTRPFDPEEDWVGEEAWAIVGVREDKEYGKQNNIRRWILPK